MLFSFCSLVRRLVVRLSMPSSPCTYPLEQNGRGSAFEDAYGQEQSTFGDDAGLDSATAVAIAALDEIDIRWASEMERNVELDDAQKHRRHVNALRAQHPAVEVPGVNDVLAISLVVQMVVIAAGAVRNVAPICRAIYDVLVGEASRSIWSGGFQCRSSYVITPTQCTHRIDPPKRVKYTALDAQDLITVHAVALLKDGRVATARWSIVRVHPFYIPPSRPSLVAASAAAVPYAIPDEDGLMSPRLDFDVDTGFYTPYATRNALADALLQQLDAQHGAPEHSSRTRDAMNAFIHGDGEVLILREHRECILALAALEN